MKEITRRNFIPLAGMGLLGVSCLSVNKNNDNQIKSNLVIYPKRLKKGSLVGVCAPAGAIKDAVEIKEFEDKLVKLGYQVKFSENISGRTGYFSASDETRANDFMELIKDDNVEAIFFIRGGWGAARILEYLDFDVIQANPKIIMGFSDITTLLNAITSNTGLVTFHGPGGNSTWNDYSVNYINQLLVQGKEVQYANRVGDLQIKTIVPGVSKGELYGGNLSVLTSLLGSDYLPNWEGKILFLEDIGEEPYRVDRMLTQLKLNGLFDKLNGIILGNFRKCIPEEPEISFTLEEVFDQHFKGLSIPVFYGAQIGHIKNKFTLPVGAMISMNADKGEFKLLEKAVI